MVFDMYNKMGDQISMQYGGSVAHHAQMGKKKGLGSTASEAWTSIVRHINNVYIDPHRQRHINLFLGIYNPMVNQVPIWKMEDEADIHTPSKISSLPHMVGTKWWVPYVLEFENHLPEMLR